MSTSDQAAEESGLFELDYKPAKGRFLIASKGIQPGDAIISERAFSTVLLNKNNYSICCYCYKHSKVFTNCKGCLRSRYCSDACKLTAWKRYHWFECFVEDYLAKVQAETALALRTLLQAAYTVAENTTSGEDVLTKIREDFVTTVDKDDAALKTYLSNYMGVYHLQTHCHEKDAQSTFVSVHKEVVSLAKLLADCVSLCDKLKILERDHTKLNTHDKSALLGNVFENLAFKSYWNLESFDIRFWKFFLTVKSEGMQDDGSASRVSIQELLFQPPTSVQAIIERLLMRHALQTRTNGQAIFEIHSSVGESPVYRLEQQRLGTGFFSNNEHDEPLLLTKHHHIVQWKKYPSKRPDCF